MDTRSADQQDPARVLNPLWIISLFLGLAEVTVGIAATQADGWIQGLLAIFSVVFPSAVAAAFFRILWTRPFVLYAPKDYPDQPGLNDYVKAVSSATDRSLENVEASIRSAFEKVIVPQLNMLEDDQRRRLVVDEAIETARRDFKQRAIEIDLSEIDSKLAGTPLVFPVTDDTTVTELLDTVYFAISAFVDSHTYDQRWVLGNTQTGQLYTNMGRVWARSTSGQTGDRRRLTEVGIQPGVRLRALWLRPHSR